jgi:hypothetical protein
LTKYRRIFGAGPLLARPSAILAVAIDPRFGIKGKAHEQEDAARDYLFISR